MRILTAISVSGTSITTANTTQQNRQGGRTTPADAPGTPLKASVHGHDHGILRRGRDSAYRRGIPALKGGPRRPPTPRPASTIRTPASAACAQHDRRNNLRGRPPMSLHGTIRRNPRGQGRSHIGDPLAPEA
ncbi:MAG: hypothetical protein BJ554DRAFT_1130 [Olpidium bornovanus]|uniref:Uncharacterized protein n=1 Tax=Olpidium bornovanus TaxID=278681 RepID=A0A8H8A2P9_9FUNG|nr:MAG: hypothetical protein BJ554DRAFT_1130 [Olpidium bornovanus]